MTGRTKTPAEILIINNLLKINKERLYAMRQLYFGEDMVLCIIHCMFAKRK